MQLDINKYSQTINEIYKLNRQGTFDKIKSSSKYQSMQMKPFQSVRNVAWDMGLFVGGNLCGFSLLLKV